MNQEPFYLKNNEIRGKLLSDCRNKISELYLNLYSMLHILYLKTVWLAEKLTKSEQDKTG